MKGGDDEQAEPRYRAFFSLPRDRFNARGFGGKVYGVCLLVREDMFCNAKREIENRVDELEWDLEGRVLKFEMPHENMVVFGVYAVNGTDNPYRDPKTGLIAGTRHDRKRAFHTQLRAEVETCERKGWSVIIAGDLNIARASVDGFPGIRLATFSCYEQEGF